MLRISPIIQNRTPAQTMAEQRLGSNPAASETTCFADRRSQNTKQLTIWGLTPRQLHDARWTGYGVQCVRVGQSATDAIDRTADLYLLLEADQCALFDLSLMIERIVWHGARVTRVRIIDVAPRGYDERIVCDHRGLVQRIERHYNTNGGAHATARRTFITDRPELAKRWLNSASPREGWTSIRRALGSRSIRSGRIDRVRIAGRSFTLREQRSETSLLEMLVASWNDPDRVIDGLDEVRSGVWKLTRDQDPDAEATPGLVGPIWMGCGRSTPDESCIVGPAWLQDDQDALQAARALDGRHPATVRSIPEIELNETPPAGRRTTPIGRGGGGAYPMVKRGLDITMSAAALLAASPLMLLIGISIWVSDGRPIFFRHKRQTIGGRLFHCLKFRTMHHDADRIMAGDALKELNVCDGAQMYIPDDPRVTCIGRILRKTHLDELPQLWNVLVGEMSLVGPRPSPDSENRFCPAWRELRLSVRPGLTGLWQLKRTRSPGRDFQEWIRYDTEYVRNAGLALDLCILAATARILVFGRSQTQGEEQ